EVKTAWVATQKKGRPGGLHAGLCLRSRTQTEQEFHLAKRQTQPPGNISRRKPLVTKPGDGERLFIVLENVTGKFARLYRQMRGDVGQRSRVGQRRRIGEVFDICERVA